MGLTGHDQRTNCFANTLCDMIKLFFVLLGRLAAFMGEIKW